VTASIFVYHVTAD